MQVSDIALRQRATQKISMRFAFAVVVDCLFNPQVLFLVSQVFNEGFQYEEFC